jgi:hypothetical protein
MKRLITIIAALALFSCSKDDSGRCTTCTETNSGYSQKFCGTRRDVKIFEDELKRQGANFGQKWTCK